MIQLKSAFTIIYKTENYVLIEDNYNDLEEHNLPCKTVTNDAHSVVSYLHYVKILSGKTRLYYIDTDGHVDELVHDVNGNFIRFERGFKNEAEFRNKLINCNKTNCSCENTFNVIDHICKCKDSGCTHNG